MARRNGRRLAALLASSALLLALFHARPSAADGAYTGECSYPCLPPPVATDCPPPPASLYPQPPPSSPYNTPPPSSSGGYPPPPGGYIPSYETPSSGDGRGGGSGGGFGVAPPPPNPILPWYPWYYRSLPSLSAAPSARSSPVLLLTVASFFVVAARLLIMF